MAALGRYILVLTGLGAAFFAVLFGLAPAITVFRGGPDIASSDKPPARQLATMDGNIPRYRQPRKVSQPARAPLPTQKPIITGSPDTSEAQPAAATPEADAMRKTLYRASLRAQPDGNADRLHLLDAGTELRLLAVEGEWAHVRSAQSGEEGWVLSKQIGLPGEEIAAVDLEEESEPLPPRRDTFQYARPAPRATSRARGRDWEYRRVVLPDGRTITVRRVYPGPRYSVPYRGPGVVFVRPY